MGGSNASISKEQEFFKKNNHLEAELRPSEGASGPTCDPQVHTHTSGLGGKYESTGEIVLLSRHSSHPSYQFSLVAVT